MREQARGAGLPAAARALIIGVLILNIGAYGCLTSGLWKDKRAGIRQTVSSRKLAVLVLKDDQIALLQERPGNSPFDSLATIYRFKKSAYELIKPKIKKVLIREELRLSAGERKIISVNPTFVIALTNGIRIEPEFLDAAPAKRSEHAVLFDDARISFDRTIVVEKTAGPDASWLWKIPLTPAAAALDTAGVALGISAAAPVLLLYGLSQSAR